MTDTPKKRRSGERGKDKRKRKIRSCAPLPKRRIGAPSKLTPEVATVIYEALQRGHYLDTAAALAGLDKITLTVWLKKGAADPEGPYGIFNKSVKEYMARGMDADLAKISRAAEDAELWKAAAWKLERRHRMLWGPRVKIETGEAEKIPALFRVMATVLRRHLSPEVAREIMLDIGRAADETLGALDGTDATPEAEDQLLAEATTVVEEEDDHGGLPQVYEPGGPRPPGVPR